LIALQLFLKRVEDVSEETCDADSVYVIQGESLARGPKLLSIKN